MSNLSDHAEIELRAAGYSPQSEDHMDKVIYDMTMVIVDAFSQCGHSGGSAAAHTWMINQLLQFKAITPITDNPEDWIDVSDFMGPGPTGVWQNRREGSLFSEDGGKTYYDLDELPRGWRRKVPVLRRKKMHQSQPHNMIVENHA